jgi:hypothetical protein
MGPPIRPSPIKPIFGVAIPSDSLRHHDRVNSPTLLLLANLSSVGLGAAPPAST